MADLTSKRVWQEIDRNIFAILGMVTAKHEARTVGITYIVDDQKLFITSQKTAWKVRHIAQNSAVSMTIPICKRIPLLPFVKIPAATITFAAKAHVIDPWHLTAHSRKRLYRHNADNPDVLDETSIIVVIPQKDFITYGVGVPMWQMPNREKARGRLAVADSRLDLG